MAESENLTLQMLRQIDRKLERLLKKLSSENSWESSSVLEDASVRSACAKEIAALTPRAVRQTDTVQLLHEDRSR
jgi:hypothetical protein